MNLSSLLSLYFSVREFKSRFLGVNMGLPNTPSGNNQPKPGSGSGQKQQTPVEKVQHEIPKRVNDALNKK
jgi:hypothetical protein